MPSRKTPLIFIRKSPLTFISFVVPLFFLLGALSALKARPAAENQNPTEAARLNGIGVALMNQQLTEKAAAKFEEAHAADPQSAIPVLNRGIALLYLQKPPEAEQLLQQAAKTAP